MMTWWDRFQYWRGDVLRLEFRILLVFMLLAALLCLLVGFGFAADSRGKWINSAGLLFDVSGVIQLHISGLFEEVLRHFGDDEKFPYGPPSNIMRKIIDNPDAPLRMWLRNNLFFEATTAFYLLLTGFVFQLVGTWV